MGSAMGSTTADADPDDISIADHQLSLPYRARVLLEPLWWQDTIQVHARSFSQTQDHQVRIFLFFVYPALSRRYDLQSFLLRCQGGCGREPFAIGASLAVQPDFSRLWRKVTRVVKIRNSLDAVSSFREPFFAKPLLSCGPSSLLVRLMPDETGQF
ncbi:hypothetical protein T03_9723 [Trichinella britovi]|uniref:Uncharacterized protein n=1 Tax=Trichinella britovi TaxID=45882 RepID=A0A0V1CTG6_TRIBR|nr:hypothetical protein T03_9723 [Trichinella britovi]